MVHEINLKHYTEICNKILSTTTGVDIRLNLRMEDGPGRGLVELQIVSKNDEDDVKLKMRRDYAFTVAEEKSFLKDQSCEMIINMIFLQGIFKYQEKYESAENITKHEIS